MNKDQIRQQLLNQRNALSDEARTRHSAAICKKIRNSSLWKNARRIGIYYPIGKEVDISNLFESSKNLYLPATHNGQMQFHVFKANDSLSRGEYGIPQPMYQVNYKEPLLDICIVPLVGFDGEGNRIGMGAGFYDKYFGAHNTSTILIGAAYQLQAHIKLPADDWDVKLQHVFTEKKHISL